MTFEIGQKIKHIEYGSIGTFLGSDGKQFTVILDNQALALDSMPIKFMSEWTSEIK